MCAIKSEQGMKFSQYSLKFSSLYWVQVDIPCSNYRGNKKKKKIEISMLWMVWIEVNLIKIFILM